MALVGAIFLMVADLLDGATRAIRFANYKTATLQAEQLAIQRLACEAREAVNITWVGNNGLNLTRFDDSVDRFSGAPTGNWPYVPMMNVTYYLDTNNNLMRQISTSSASPAAQPVASGISGFVTANDTAIPSNLDLQLSIQQESDFVQVINVTVWIPTSQ